MISQHEIAKMRHTHVTRKYPLGNDFDVLYEVAQEIAETQRGLPLAAWPPMSRLMYVPDLLTYYLAHKLFRVRGVENKALEHVPGFVLQVYTVNDARVRYNHMVVPDGKPSFQHPLQTTKFGVLLPSDSPQVTTGLRLPDLVRELIRDMVACNAPVFETDLHKAHRSYRNVPSWLQGLTEDLKPDFDIMEDPPSGELYGEHDLRCYHTVDYEPTEALLTLEDEFGIDFQSWPGVDRRTLDEPQDQAYYIDPHKTLGNVRSWHDYPYLWTHLSLLRLNKTRLLQFIAAAWGYEKAWGVTEALHKIRLRFHGGDHEYEEYLHLAEEYYYAKENKDYGAKILAAPTPHDWFLIDQPFVKLLDAFNFYFQPARDVLGQEDRRMAQLPNDEMRYHYAANYPEENLPF